MGVRTAGGRDGRREGGRSGKGGEGRCGGGDCRRPGGRERSQEATVATLTGWPATPPHQGPDCAP